MDIASGSVRELCKPPSGTGEEDNFSLEEKLRRRAPLSHSPPFAPHPLFPPPRPYLAPALAPFHPPPSLLHSRPPIHLRERARQLHTGITSYAWAEGAEGAGKILVPMGNELFVQEGLDGPLCKLLDPSVLLEGGGGAAPVPPILDARISSDGSIVAFVWSSELYMVPTDRSSPPKQLTTGARGTALTNGLADYVAQVPSPDAPFAPPTREHASLACHSPRMPLGGMRLKNLTVNPRPQTAHPGRRTMPSTAYRSGRCHGTRGTGSRLKP